MVVMLVSIVVYSLIPVTALWAKMPVSSRVLALPLIAGLSYEMIRFAAKHRSGLLATRTAPGPRLQRITTHPAGRRSDRRGHLRPRWSHGAGKEQGGQLVIA